MPSPQRDNRFIIAAVVVVLLAYGANRFWRGIGNNVNPFDSRVRKIESFELQEGEVGVTVRVRLGQQPASGVTVWAEWDAREEEKLEPYRKGTTNAEGLVQVPVRKGGSGQTEVFARDSAGRVALGQIAEDRLLSAGDLVLAEVALRKGRMLTDEGNPIADAVLTAESFSACQAEAESPFIKIPQPLRSEYTVRTNAAGEFTLKGIPVGFDCKLRFATRKHGEGEMILPADSDGDCRLARAGSVRLRIAGEGKAADVRQLRCRLEPVDRAAFQRKPGTVSINGHREWRHDGSRELPVGNIVPGEYQLHIDGTPRNPVLPEKSVRVVIESEGTAEAVVSLKRAGRVLGRVVDGESAAGIRNVRLRVWGSPVGSELSYGGTVVTAGDGRFTAFVPADVPVTIAPDRCPEGYSSPRGPLAALMLDAEPVKAASGEEVTIGDVKLYRQGSISGTVVANGQPVPNAVVEVRWDQLQRHKPVTLTTDASGKFRIANVPPGQPALLRVRAGGLVNDKVFLAADELVGSLQIPISAQNACHIRGRVTDGRGQAVVRAKVVVVSTVQPPRKPFPADKPPDMKQLLASGFSGRFQPAEVEAVFTDAEGRFEAGPLWPGCSYGLTISADGMTSCHLRAVEGKAGEAHEVRPVVLIGRSAEVVGRVIEPNGQPIAGATVINSGDGPRRLETRTDGAGHFSLTGLLDYPAVVVAHKAGYRWAHAVIRPSDPEAKIILRPLADPPVPIAQAPEEQRRAEAELIRRLTAIADKRPKPPAGAADPWAEARQDLDAYLARLAKKGDASASHTLLALARELAQQDREKALRVLREAAAAARRLTLPTNQPGAAMLRAFAGDMAGILRVQQLVPVIEEALAMDARAEARDFLTEAEAMTMRLPPAQRLQPLGQLAQAWVQIDPDRTEKLLASLASDSRSWDQTVAGIINRLQKEEPNRAVGWLERFKDPGDDLAQESRAELAVRFAERDLAQATRLAEALRHPVYRSLARARLATAAGKSDPKRAQELIGQAVEDLTGGPPSERYEPEQRMGAAIYLLWQAKAVDYPDLASLVAVALTTRPPLPPGEHALASWRSNTLNLAAGVASLDPATGRSLLGPEGNEREPDEEEGNHYLEFLTLALADPAAALARLEEGGKKQGDRLDPHTAAEALAALKKRSEAASWLRLLDRVWWVQKEGA